MTTSDKEQLSTGRLRTPLRLERVLSQPGWILNDLAPTLAELREPSEYVRGVRLWLRVRQDGYTLLGCRRGRTLHRLARDVERRPVAGAIVDCGVWNGGSSAMMASAAPTRTVWAFDSFEGLPEPTAEDGDGAREWVGSALGREENVREAFRRYARHDQLKIVKGWFQDTIVPAAAEIGPIAVLHADGDLYESILVPLRGLYDQMSPGGWVVVDDYTSWAGARQAVDDFRGERGITSRLFRAEASAYWQVAAR